MNNNIIEYLLTQGPFAALFVWLLVYVMKNNKEREGRLYKTITQQNNVLGKFSEKYDVVITRLDEIKDKLK